MKRHWRISLTLGFEKLKRFFLNAEYSSIHETSCQSKADVKMLPANVDEKTTVEPLPAQEESRTIETINGQKLV